jgi:hypothetical protein
MSFDVYVGDNFHYQEESEKYKKREYSSYEEALAAAQAIVDQFLQDNVDKHDSAEALLSSYKSYGDDPYILGEPKSHQFSAWKYAKEQCQRLYSNN